MRPTYPLCYILLLHRTNGRRSVVINDLVFERELDTHRIPSISESPYIRRLLDVIDPEDGAHEAPRKLVFEWLDTDLWKYRPYGKLSHPKLL